MAQESWYQQKVNYLLFSPLTVAWGDVGEETPGGAEHRADLGHDELHHAEGSQEADGDQVGHTQVEDESGGSSFLSNSFSASLYMP